MKKIIIITLIFFLGNILIFSEGKAPFIKPLIKTVKANTVTSTLKTNTNTKMIKSKSNEKKVNEIKSDLPKIPADWGHLVKGQFIMDGAYLALYFEDSFGNIRIAVYSIDKKVKLYKLMVFPREQK